MSCGRYRAQSYCGVINATLAPVDLQCRTSEVVAAPMLGGLSGVRLGIGGCVWTSPCASGMSILKQFLNLTSLMDPYRTPIARPNGAAQLRFRSMPCYSSQT